MDNVDVVEIPSDLPLDTEQQQFLDLESFEVSSESSSYVYSLLESFLNDSKLLYKLNEIGNDFYAIVNTFTFGELAIFIMLFVFYLTYLLFKFWSVFR